MNKDSIFTGIIGLLLGLILGFLFTNSINQRGGSQAAVGGAQQSAELPPDHPPIPPGAGGQAGPDMKALQQAISLATSEQNNFDAQMKAAQYSYQAQHFDDAIRFFQRANQLQPDSYEAIVGLGNVNFDASRYEEAEKWYASALKTRPDDVNVRTDLGLTFMFREPANLERAIAEFRASLERDPRHVQTLQNLTVALTRKGDAGEARTTLERLEEVSPASPAINALRADIEKLKTQTVKAEGQR
jgi:tetratricopeptide (TPR) repeat protein